MPDPQSGANDSVLSSPPSLDTTAEGTLAQILRALQRARDGRPVGLDDTWPELGGDARTALRAVSELHRHGIGLTPDQLLTASSIRVLVDLAVPTTPPVRRVGGSTVVTTPAHYNIVSPQPDDVAVTLARLFEVVPGDLPVTDLNRALTRVFARHEAFRTRFAWRSGVWRGHLLETSPTVEAVKLSAHPPTDGQPLLAPLASLLRREHQEISVASGKLWHVATYYCLETRQRWLYLIMHALIADPMSLDIIARELAGELDNAGTHTDAPAFIPPALPPTDHDLEPWRAQRSRDLPRLTKALPQHESATPLGLWVHANEELDVATTGALLDLVRRRNVPMQSVLVAALSRALRPFSTYRVPGLYVWLPADSRTVHPDAGVLVGALTSYFPALLIDAGAMGTNQGTDGSSAGEVPLGALADRYTEQLAAFPTDRSAFGWAHEVWRDQDLWGHLPRVRLTDLGQRSAVTTECLREMPGHHEQVYGDKTTVRHHLDVTAEVIDGRLRLQFAGDPEVLDIHDLDRVRTAMRTDLDLLAHVQPITRTPGEAPRPRVFTVHPASGDLRQYTALADALAGHADCFGLAAQPIAPSGVSVDTVGRLSCQYVRSMRAFQPSGPYVLLGYGCTAMIAYAAARWIAAADRPVHLILIAPPAAPPTMPEASGGVDPSVLRVDLQHIAGLDSRIADELVRHAVNASGTGAAEVVEAIAVTEPELAERVETLLGMTWLVADWRPQRGTVAHVTVLHANDPDSAAAAADWAKLADTSHIQPLLCDRAAVLTDPDALAAIADVIAHPPAPVA